ncbi:hypothetical protein [Clostridium ljungdahlii]|uniref:hypothetical protein n=1 Tax=Clostridium ljungdahlii TaxID=1538 RepID=UPI0012E8ECA0|nr:hypothetical protein [Clostridium ljungdahlii]
MVTSEEFNELGEIFENIEEEKFGADGFNHIANDIAKFEQVSGIYNLSQFTPTEISISSLNINITQKISYAN